MKQAAVATGARRLTANFKESAVEFFPDPTGDITEDEVPASAKLVHG